MKTSSIIAVLSLLCAIASAKDLWPTQASWPGPNTDLDTHVAALNVAGSMPWSPQLGLRGLAHATGVPIAKVRAQMRANPELGLGDLFVANALARATGNSAGQFIAEHDSGRTWGQIAAANPIDLGSLTAHMTELRERVEHQAEDSGW